MIFICNKKYINYILTKYPINDSIGLQLFINVQNKCYLKNMFLLAHLMNSRNILLQILQLRGHVHVHVSRSYRIQQKLCNQHYVPKT